MAIATTLIGRRTELETIEQVVEAARSGTSGVLLLRGVAGVGKTALLEHAAEAARDARVLRAEGVEAESELAFAGLHQLLRPLTPHFDRLPALQRAALEAAFGISRGEAGDRFLVATGALGLLAEAAEEQPVLCVVDDLHWLDRPTVDALAFVARRLVAEPVALLLAMRDSASVPAGLQRCPTLELGGLGREHARELLELSGRLAPAERERVLDAAGGVPLALLELPHGPLAGGTTTMGAVERSFADRLSLLPERARRAVLLAAGDDDPEARTALQALPHAGLTVEDLAAAEAEGLLWVAGERLAFRHPLVRSAAYGLAPFAERRDAHVALAEALTGPADADRRAWHRAAGLTAPDAEVATELAQSAERARARGGHAAASVALERAARLTSDEPLRARRLVDASEAARLTGDVEHAVTLAEEALVLAADPGTAAEAAALRAAIRAHRGDGEGEEELLGAAHALADGQPRRALRTALLAAEAAALGGHHARAADTARWAASLPVGAADADQAVVAFATGIGHLFAGQPRDAAADFAVSLELSARSGDPQVMVWAATGTIYGGDIPGGRQALAHAVALARELGAIPLVAYGLQALAYVELVEGRIGVAGTDAAEGLTLSLESGEERFAVHCRGTLAWHAAIRGRDDDCRALAAEALAGRPARVAAEAAGRALALLDLGDARHEAAFDRLAAMVADPRGHSARRLLAVGDLVEAAVGCGRGEEARPALEQLAAYAGATGSAWAAATVAGAEVQLAQDAAAAYAEAMRAHAAIELPFDRGRIELRMGEQLRRARRRVDARRHLRAALDLFAQTGAAAWERRAAAELRATGETARKRDPSTLDDLTAQEQQIARMVAEGSTNREIAGRLFLSPRTVDYHLRKVFQKLSVTSRTQLAALDW
jgi:DNA-binding CsgD family transcriptional regulator